MMLQKFQNILLYTKTSSRWYYEAKKDSESISSGGGRLNWIKWPSFGQHHTLSATPFHQQNKGGTWTQLAPQDWEIASILMLLWNLPQALFPPVTPGKLPKSHTASFSFHQFALCAVPYHPLRHQFPSLLLTRFVSHQWALVSSWGCCRARLCWRPVARPDSRNNWACPASLWQME